MSSSRLIWPGVMGIFCAIALRAADAPKHAVVPGLHSALPEAKWEQIDGAVDRGLAWIATQQGSDGHFGLEQTAPSAQPAVTSLAVMAFLARGHQPGYGPYGENLNRAIDFVISCQMPNGLFSYEVPGPFHGINTAAGNATYNHAIAGLMLGEVYGQVTGARMKKVKAALNKALAFTRDLQTREKAIPDDKGGWRYLRLFTRYGSGGPPSDSDMSVTAWQLMFLRSARNAEFQVPQNYIDEAMDYIHRSYDDAGIFYYTIGGFQGGQYSRGLVGAGIVSLSLAGEHNSPRALTAGNWLLDHPFTVFDEVVGSGSQLPNGGDRFYYSVFYCSQAAAQLGGRYWDLIYPAIAEILLTAQNSEGSWPMSGSYGGAGGFLGEGWIGPVYPTCMAILALTPGDQILPVYQR